MKLQRLLGALCAGLMFVSLPVRAAEQASYVTPIVGPMNMATFAGTYLNPALRAIASCHNGTSAPANGPSGVPLAYQCWVDTTANPSLYKIYDGASWITLGSINTTTHAWLPYLTGGVSGGVPYFSATNVMGSSAALPLNGFVVGGGAGAAPSAIAACTDDQVAFGRASNSPLCRSITGDITFAAGVSAIGPSKVVNAQLATMAANTTKCNASAGTANPTDCSAATMRTGLGLVVGANVQAWDTDLDCLAAISTTGTVKRTGSGTCSAGAVALSDLATGTQDTVIGYFGSTTSSATAISNCAGALTYSTATHTFGCNASAGTGTVTSVGLTNTFGLSISGSPVTTSGNISAGVSLTTASNTLGADVNLNNTGLYFDGPSMAQGTTGTWFASGNVLLLESSGAVSFQCKLWDGTTVVASAVFRANAASTYVAGSLSGVFVSPAANIRISCNDPSFTTGKIVFNGSGNSKDSNIVGVRIQ